MNNKPKDIGGPAPSLLEAGERLALPLFLFSFILFFFLLLSWVFLLPYVSQIHVRGNRTDLRELQSYHRELTGRLRLTEEEREDLVLPVHDSLYKELRLQKLSRQSFLRFIEEIYGIAAHIVPTVKDAVRVERLHVAAEQGTLDIRGRVRHVGPRSMTVLAQFADALAESPLVASLDHPTFTREQNSEGFFSPFLIHAEMSSPLTP